MLVSCPECQLQISDKAVICPHCGYPLQNPKSKNPLRKNSRKRMRLPNGFGQISEIKGQNLRKPFRAMVSDGKKPNGRPIVKPLKPESYFETYNEAYTALVEYHRNPYDIEPSITVEQLYERWLPGYLNTLESESGKRTIPAAWKYCNQIASMRVSDVRARHIKGVIDNGYKLEKGIQKYPSDVTKSRMKSLFNMMLDYAVEYEIVDKNYARTFDLSDDIIEGATTAKKAHMAFTDTEMKLLWENINYPYVDALLFQCYSGWRPQEIGLIRVEDVNLETGLIKGGMKTAAGKNRMVPIHSKIENIIRARIEEAKKLGSEFLFNCPETGTTSRELRLTYDKYDNRFKNIKNNLGLDENHRPHDGRVQFVTMAKKAGLDEYAIKYIVGHKIDDITERVYTKREATWLKTEIEKIK